MVYGICWLYLGKTKDMGNIKRVETRWGDCTVSLHGGSKVTERWLYCGGSWFEGASAVSIEYGEGFIVLRKHYDFPPDDARRINRMGVGRYHVYCGACEVPFGNMVIDVEDSSEDELVCYYK